LCRVEVGYGDIKRDEGRNDKLISETPLGKTDVKRKGWTFGEMYNLIEKFLSSYRVAHSVQSLDYRMKDRGI
jgi:hypothetical protein